MVHYRLEEVIIKITQNYECQEIHKNVHDGIVGVEDDNVDDLDKDDHIHLKETIKPCNLPLAELPWVIDRELHELTTLSDFVLQGDVQQDGTEETSKANDAITGRRIEIIAKLFIIENLFNQVKCQCKLAAD